MPDVPNVELAAPDQQTTQPAGAGMTTSCPHCGRAGILFGPHEWQLVIQCAKCGGKFTPAGGAVMEQPAAAPEPQSVVPLAGGDSDARLSPVSPQALTEFSGELPQAPYTLGALLAFAGFWLIAYFWLVYDTTVRSYGERVHNMGRMQDRLIGIEIGLGFLAVGTVLLVSCWWLAVKTNRPRPQVPPLLVVFMACAVTILLFLFLDRLSRELGWNWPHLTDKGRSFISTAPIPAPASRPCAFTTAGRAKANPA
jgi:ribosomal protein S27E